MKIDIGEIGSKMLYFSLFLMLGIFPMLLILGILDIGDDYPIIILFVMLEIVMIAYTILSNKQFDKLLSRL